MCATSFQAGLLSSTYRKVTNFRRNFGREIKIVAQNFEKP